MVMPKAGPKLILLVFLFLAACQPQAAVTSTVTQTNVYIPVGSPTTTTLTLTSTPSLVPTPSPTIFPLPTSGVPIVTCSERYPADNDLLAVVTASFGLAPGYRPDDLVILGNYLPGIVSLPENLMRREAAKALGKMIEMMRIKGLAPTVLSSFRSYVEQDVAHRKAEAEDPQNASQVSALPGHSEHQLGTVVDFGSPELAALTDNPSIRFSPVFEQTSEGQWLIKHAHEYGFTMTNLPEAEPWTGLTFEPWHYRYVGIEFATYLYQNGYFLSKFLLQARPELPCIPSLSTP
jgi:zinc D-Ala-D-Ala carboxypeptidase